MYAGTYTASAAISANDHIQTRNGDQYVDSAGGGRSFGGSMLASWEVPSTDRDRCREGTGDRPTPHRLFFLELLLLSAGLLKVSLDLPVRFDQLNDARAGEHQAGRDQQ